MKRNMIKNVDKFMNLGIGDKFECHRFKNMILRKIEDTPEVRNSAEVVYHGLNKLGAIIRMRSSDRCTRVYQVEGGG